MLEKEAENAGGNRTDRQQPAKASIGIPGGEVPIPQRAPDAAEDALPVVEEEEKEDERGSAVGGDQEGKEIVVVLVDVPAEGPGEDDPVAEAGDREGLGDALDQAEDDRLEI